MPDELRAELGAPVGKVLTKIEDLVKETAGTQFLITVGDIVTLDFLEAGKIPDLSIVDYATQRMPMEQVRSRFSKFEQPVIFVINPMSQITAGLWSAIKDGIENPRHLRIVVDGEEDLASLASIALAPPGTTVIYGIPNRGASVHYIDAELKHLVDRVLKQMELK